MTLNDKEWQGDYWGPNGALTQRRRELRAKLGKTNTGEEQRGALGALSSLHYSASGDALQVRAPHAHGLVELVWWYLIGWWNLELALWYSNRQRGYGLELMTATDCDVRQSICRAGARLPWHHRMLHEAAIAIALGLHLVSRFGHGKPSMHTRPLLLIGRADVKMRRGRPKQEVLHDIKCAHLRADQVVGHFSENPFVTSVIEEKRQYSRVYRHLTRLYALMDMPWDSMECHEMAIRLASESGAEGQLAKMV